MFVKKYRTKDITKIIGLPENLPKIDENMPHLFLYGLQGTGKSLLSEAIKNKLGWNTLHLNGSDFRGIDVIRETVKQFMMTRSTDGNPKLLRFEEADNITQDAQKMLRELLETYANNCKVIFTLNYPNKVIDPLKSRCVQINMNDKQQEEIFAHLEGICMAEKIKYEPEALNLIIEKYSPDIRSMLNKIEEFAERGNITKESIVIDENKVKELFDLIKAKNFTQARTWVLNSNWGHSEILNQLYKYALKTDLEGQKKLNVILQIGECDFRMGLSTDREVQMSCGLVNIMKAMS